MNRYVPQIKGMLRSHIIEMPEVIRQVSGIKIFGKVLKSFIFTTDIAVIKNNNADAIIAVYPFTPQPLITQTLVSAADVPVFCGVGGGTTTGKRVVNLALDAEFKGAMGVVLNASISNEVIQNMRETIDLPIIVTIASIYDDIDGRIEAGATILNVSGGKETANIVKHIRSIYPDVPIIATGGPTDETIKEAIAAGANAITYTPQSSAEILTEIMVKQRGKYNTEE